MTQDKEDIAALVQSYIEAYNRADFDACLNCYRLPFGFVAARGVSVVQRPEEFLAMWKATHAEMQTAGYSHSAIAELHVRPLEESIALVSIAVVRYRNDGSEIETVGGLYTLRRGREGWKIVAVASQRGDELLRFD